jgi:hypothetical protein
MVVKGMDKGIMFKAWIEIEVRDKEGRLIKEHKQPMRSFVENFMRALRGLFYSNATSGVETVITIDGVSMTYPQIYVGYEIIKVRAPAGDDTYGILVGSGTAPPTPSDHNLVTKIPNGTEAGQLSYGETSLDPINVTGNNIILRIIRTFTNNSGASITVSEVGLAAQTRHQSLGYKTFLIARDVLTSSINVPDGSTLTVRYVIQVTT